MKSTVTFRRIVISNYSCAIETANRNRQRLRTDERFLRVRFVFLDAGILFGEHRSTMPFDQLRMKTAEFNRFGLRIDGDDMNGTRAVALDVR